MNLRSAFITAFQSFSRNRLRFFLTSIGIIIGIASVIIVVGLGDSARLIVNERVYSMGTNTIEVEAKTPLFNDRDIKRISEIIPDYKYISPFYYGGRKQIYNRHYQLTGYVYGVTTPIIASQGYDLDHGRLFHTEDYQEARSVAVVGHGHTAGHKTPLIGQNIKIMGKLYTIVGVLKSKGNMISTSERKIDNIVFLPYSTMFQKYEGTSQFNRIRIITNSTDTLRSSEILLKNYLTLHYPDKIDTFDIKTSLQQLETARGITAILSLLLVGIASISLVVAGVVIMNIMLVSVTERTREIGIRMAIGAKKRDILLQFLVEAVSLTLVGGVIGLITGLLGYYLIATAIKWPFVLSPVSIISSFLVSSIVGIFFGYYPAKKASELKPIEALKFE